MKPVRTYQGTVYPWQCDHMGHMNVQFYAGKFDEAIWNIFSRLGLTVSYLRANNRGMVAVEQHIKYLREALAGENVFIESEVKDVKEKTIFIRHVMYKFETGEVAAETDITGAHIDTILRKAVPLPAFVREKFKTFASQ